MFMIKSRPGRAAMGGYSLVELMVGSVIGLIVIGAVTALVLSMMRSNRQTLQSTRLNQELRATLAVIANDIKRARGVVDPFTVATSALGNTVEQIDTGTSACVSYGYEVVDPSGNPSPVWHRIHLDTGANRLLLAEGTSANTACPVTTSPTTVVTLGSEQVAISNLTVTPSTATADDRRTIRRLDISITGRLNDSDSELSGITRTMRQTVFIRSIGDGT